jgi:hypothetical protein
MVRWQVSVLIIAVGIGILVGILLYRVFKRQIPKKNKEIVRKNLPFNSPLRTEEAEKTKEPAEQKIKRVEMLAGEEATQKNGVAKKEVVTGLYHGNVELTVLPPVNVERLTELLGYLGQILDCRLLLVGGSVDVGPYFVLSLNKPLNLGDKLREIPIVDEVIKNGKKIGIILK